MEALFYGYQQEIDITSTCDRRFELDFISALITTLRGEHILHMNFRLFWSSQSHIMNKLPSWMNGDFAQCVELNMSSRSRHASTGPIGLVEVPGSLVIMNHEITAHCQSNTKIRTSLTG